MVSGDLERYQRSFASRFGAKHAFGFWKGRVALYAILKAMGIGEGDDVLMPGYTCVMAVNPIVYLGAKPIFVDIQPGTYNIDANQIEERITSATKLIIAQHTYGYPADLDAIRDIADRKGVRFIEDCCLATGSRYNDQLVGTFGHAAYFSFQWNKTYTTGLGGMAITSDTELADGIHRICEEEMVAPSVRNVAMLRAQLAVYRTLIYPRTTTLAQSAFRWLVGKGILVGSSSTRELGPAMERGFLCGMSRLQARSGYRQLRRFDDIAAHRRKMRSTYDELLAERGWPVFQAPENTDPVLVRYPVRVADKTKALATAARNLVELGSWFESPLHPAATLMSAYGYDERMCPESLRACQQVVNLPLHPRANDGTARASVEFIDRIGPAA